MKIESRRALMPADRRARDQRGVHVIGYIDSRPARAERIARRALAAFMWVCALVFAYAAVLLACSADPFTLFVPAAVALFFGYCAWEIWPARARVRGGQRRDLVVRRVRSGEGFGLSTRQSAPAEGKAPAFDDV